MASWDNITKAFANIVPLSSMGMGATFGMALGGKSLDEVVREEARTRELGAYGDNEYEDDYSAYEDKYPDLVDQVMYQVDNPNAFLTPWGPVLDEETVDRVLAENPAMYDLLGMSPHDRDVVQQEADSLLTQAGDFIEDLWNWGSETAMSMGENALDVTKDLFDTTATNMVETVDNSLAGQVVRESEGRAERVLETFLPSTPALGAEPGPYLGLGEDEHLTYVDEDEGEGWWEKVVNVVQNVAEGLVPPEAQYDPVMDLYRAREQEQDVVPNQMDDALVPDLDEGYEATTEEIITDFFSLMIVGDIGSSDVDSFLSRNPELETQRSDLWNGLMGAMEIYELHRRINPAGGAPHSLELSDYTPEILADWALQVNDLVPPVNYLYAEVKPPEKAPPGAADPPDVPKQKPVDIGDIGAVGAMAALGDVAIKEPNFTKVYHEVMSTVPWGNHSKVRENAEELQAGAEVMFWLWHGGNAFTALKQAEVEGTGDYSDVESFFRAFLSSDHIDPTTGEPSGGKIGYSWNPDVYRSGDQFLQKVEELKGILRRWSEQGYEMEGFEEAENMIALFGNDDKTGNYNLFHLTKFYVTGGHTGESVKNIWDTAVRKRNYDIGMGETPTQVFMRATTSSEPWHPPFSAPPSPRPEYDFSDIASLRASPAYNLTAAGTQMVPPASRQYDFSDLAALRDAPAYNLAAPVQNIPGINTAAFSLDLGEDMPHYTDSSEGTELYKQAMKDPVMGAAMRARMGLPEAPMTGMPDELVDEWRTSHLELMPEPFDETERAKRDKGFRYQTGLWTGGSQYEWNTMSPEKKKSIIGTDEWVGGTSFVPTVGWRS